MASLSIILSRGRTTKALINLRGCVGWSASLIFECNYVRFSLDTAHKYDNVIIIIALFFNVFTPWLGRLWMTHSTSVIDDCINKLKIRGKHKEKWAKTRKKGHGGKHTRPKKLSGARRPGGPATTALKIQVSFCLKLPGTSFHHWSPVQISHWANILETCSNIRVKYVFIWSYQESSSGTIT